MKTMKKKVSPIWEYFAIDEQKGIDANFATCKICKANQKDGRINRGGKTKQSGYSNQNLKNHLKYNHPEEYKKFFEGWQKLKENEEKKNKVEGPLQKSFQKLSKLDSSSPRWQDLTKQIATMIFLDFEPLSVVEHRGFRNLIKIAEHKYEIPSRTTFTTKILPKIYYETKALLILKLQIHVLKGSFTTDI
jgi:hypothetical protein